MHFVNINRGDLVLIRTGKETELHKFKAGVNSLVRFFTFQRLSLFPDSSENYSIRRVLALPGDTVFMKDFVVYIKPAGETHFLTEYELSALHYDVQTAKLPEIWDEDVGFSGNMEQVVLRENQYMFFSDDRYHSSDSRIWGSIDGGKIIGKLVLRYWPVQSILLL